MIESYSETRVMLAATGELCLALPVYANQSGAIFDEKRLSISIGVYEKIGYMIYHPEQELLFFLNSVELFHADLGVL